MCLVKRSPVTIRDTRAPLIAKDLFGFCEFIFVIARLVCEIFSFMKTEIDGKAVLLPFVDVGETIHQFEPALKSKLRDEPQGLISPAHIKLVKTQAVIDALEVMIVVLPPVIKIPVRQFEDWRWKCVPPLIQVDDKINFVFLQFHRLDLDGVEKACVDEFLFIEVEYLWKIQAVDQITRSQAELADNDLVPGQTVSDDQYAVDEDEPARGVGGDVFFAALLLRGVRERLLKVFLTVLRKRKKRYKN